jgi:hypothetical protein
MDLFNYNTNKRKFEKSKEQEENVKRKNIENDQSIGCFRRCCTRRKHDITSIQKEKRIKISNENINQPLKVNLPIETVSKMPMTHLKRSPLYNQSKFCPKSYYDSCIECTVQYGPDVWENIPKNSNKQLYDNNKVKLRFFVSVIHIICPFSSPRQSIDLIHF